MVTTSFEAHSLEELRQLVVETLCEQHQLQVGAYQVSQQVLTRNKKPCGILFLLQGPRATRFTAIWETDRNRVLFYGSTGQRFRKIQLNEAPALTGGA